MIRTPNSSDGEVFRAVVKGLLAPFRDARISAVCGIEPGRFLLGGAAVLELGTGFVAIRKEQGLFPGAKITHQTEPDYRGSRHILRMQRSSLVPGDRVLLVDDWIETGSQALGAAGSSPKPALSWSAARSSSTSSVRTRSGSPDAFTP